MSRPKTDFTNIKCCLCGRGDLTSKTARREEFIIEDLRWKWLCVSCFAYQQKYNTTDKNKIKQIQAEYHNKKYGDRTCDKCKKILIPGKALREYNNGISTGKWLCRSCYEHTDLINIKTAYYNRTNTCDRCREEGRETKLIPGNAKREYNKEDNWTGNWICKKCWRADYYKENEKDLIKSLSVRRTNKQDPNHANTKGDNFQELTCIWRSTISTIPVEDLNKKYDNYTRGTPIDHSRDSELGIIQTQGRLYDSYNRLWVFGNLEREWDKEFDVMICYCASKDGKIIERIYIIPFEKEIKNERKSIGIVQNPMNSHGTSPIVPWYEKYRIKDPEELKKINEIWKTNCM